MAQKNNPDWWRGAIIYQIYPRSFADHNKDGIGDLKGITSKLDYVADLGVDAIWISPFFPSPMKDFGYDVSDYRGVDPIFGTLDDCKEMVEKAHELGLKVLIDQVWSHSSDQNPWFQESRSSNDNEKHDWYVWADSKPDGTPPNNWLSYFGGSAWGWDTKRQQYYFCPYLKAQPALNIWNQDVRNALLDIGRFWLDMGVDGFRMDAMQQYLYDKNLRDNPVRPPSDSLPSDTPHENPMVKQRRDNSSNVKGTIEWINELRAMVDEYDDRALMAEVGGEDASQFAIKYVQNKDRFHLAYTFDLFQAPMEKERMLEIFKEAESKIHTGWLCWTTSNHDCIRVASRWYKGDGDEQAFCYTATLSALCMRGSYCMYQGEELGLTEVEIPYDKMQDPFGLEFYPEVASRDGCRTPMVWDNTKHAGFSGKNPKDTLETWLPIPKDHIKKNVADQQKTPGSLYHQMKDFLHWRKSHEAMVKGDVEFIDTDDTVLGYRRYLKKNSVICVFNLDSQNRTFSLPKGREKYVLVESISQNVTIYEDVIVLGEYAAGFFVAP